MTKLKVLSLFAGIGGFDLGLERTNGFETVAFCEIDKRAQKVLRKHWPEVPIYDDVSELTAERLRADGIDANFICGGFPCQDISYAGRGAGLAGERSGLFYEVARLIDEMEPVGVLLENVSALLTRGLGDVLGTLASLGYDAEWHCIPASALGAPHRRDRIWVYAYPNANKPGLEGWLRFLLQERSRQRLVGEVGPYLADAEGGSERPGLCQGEQGRERRGRSGYRSCEDGQWSSEPAVGRVANGVPGRVDRLKQLGNAVVPQIPELIGRAILASLEQKQEAA